MSNTRPLKRIAFTKSLNTTFSRTRVAHCRLITLDVHIFIHMCGYLTPSQMFTLVKMCRTFHGYATTLKKQRFVTQCIFRSIKQRYRWTDEHVKSMAESRIYLSGGFIPETLLGEAWAGSDIDCYVIDSHEAPIQQSSFVEHCGRIKGAQPVGDPTRGNILGRGRYDTVAAFINRVYTVATPLVQIQVVEVVPKRLVKYGPRRASVDDEFEDDEKTKKDDGDSDEDGKTEKDDDTFEEYRKRNEYENNVEDNVASPDVDHSHEFTSSSSSSSSSSCSSSSSSSSSSSISEKVETPCHAIETVDFKFLINWLGPGGLYIHDLQSIMNRTSVRSHVVPIPNINSSQNSDEMHKYISQLWRCHKYLTRKFRILNYTESVHTFHGILPGRNRDPFTCTVVQGCMHGHKATGLWFLLEDIKKGMVLLDPGRNPSENLFMCIKNWQQGSPLEGLTHEVTSFLKTINMRIIPMILN